MRVTIQLHDPLPGDRVLRDVLDQLGWRMDTNTRSTIGNSRIYDGDQLIGWDQTKWGGPLWLEFRTLEHAKKFMGAL